MSTERKGLNYSSKWYQSEIDDFLTASFISSVVVSIRYNVIVSKNKRFEDCLIATLHQLFDGAPAHINWRHDWIQLISIISCVPFNPLDSPLDDNFFFYPISVLFCFCWVCVAHAVTANLLFLIIFWENFSNSSSYTDDCLNIRGNESKKIFFLIFHRSVLFHQ